MSRILPILNPEACGLGQGPECCAYLVAGLQRFECGRVTVAAEVLAARANAGTFTARRLPVLPYPQCQTEERT